MHKYGDAAQQAYTMLTATPTTTVNNTPTPHGHADTTPRVHPHPPTTTPATHNSTMHDDSTTHANPSPTHPATSSPPIALFLQLIGHTQLDDMSGVSLYSTAHAVYLKCQPMVLQGVPEMMMAMCRPALVLAEEEEEEGVRGEGNQGGKGGGDAGDAWYGGHLCVDMVCLDDIIQIF